MSRIVIITNDNDATVVFENGNEDVLLVNSDDFSIKQDARYKTDPELVNQMYDEFEDGF